jgi:hypothetical protein
MESLALSSPQRLPRPSPLTLEAALVSGKVTDITQSIRSNQQKLMTDMFSFQRFRSALHSRTATARLPKANSSHQLFDRYQLVESPFPDQECRISAFPIAVSVLGRLLITQQATQQIDRGFFHVTCKSCKSGRASGSHTRNACCTRTRHPGWRRQLRELLRAASNGRAHEREEN